MPDEETQWRPVQWGESNPDYDIETYNTLGVSPLIWLWQSKGHNAAAKVQWDTYQKLGSVRGFSTFHRAIALLLAGYAVETLVKMVLIDAHLRTVKFPASYTKLAQYFPTTHDLRDLAKKARLRINEGDRSVLDQLSEYVKWAGKYPVPVNARGYSGPVAMPTKAESAAVDQLWARYTRLWSKLLKQADIRLRN